jgi:hypothetical protein
MTSTQAPVPRLDRRAVVPSTSLRDWLRVIRAEYEELPDLQLTQSQVGILKKTPAGLYVRAPDR